MMKVKLRKELLSAQGKMMLDVDLSIEPEGFNALFGPSGSGKTTILRMIAGLVLPESGYIEVDGKIWFDSERKINLPPQERRLGFVFQDYSLFPNMTVRQNIEYALDDKKNVLYVDELLDMIDLTGLANQKPDKLSGGQAQRVALARALARRPKLLLLDEPFAALDFDLRERLQDEILRIYRRFKITTIFVGHDIAEMVKLSGKVFVLAYGSVARCGSPEKIFRAYNDAKPLFYKKTGISRSVTLKSNNFLH